MIVEYEDYLRYIYKEFWTFIKEQYERGESKPGCEDEWDFTWLMLQSFEKKYNIDHTLMDDRGNIVTNAQWKDLFKQYARIYKQ